MLEPASAYRWADLGELLANRRATELAKYCFERAWQAGPHNPAVLFRIGNFYFSLGQYRRTMQYLSTILRNPDLVGYYEPVFVTYSRMHVPMQEILNSGVPPDARAARLFLRFTMREDPAEDAETVWNWMGEHSLDDEAIRGEYIGYLLGKKRCEQAAEIWARVHTEAASDFRRTNWIFNGGFEAAPEASPLDWQLESSEDVQANRTQSAAREGRWSLQLEFAGKTNVGYHGTFEQAVVTPGRWRLRAFIKTEHLTTDEGVRIRIDDAAAQQNLSETTESVTGTRDWTRVERSFEIRPATSLVRVEVARRASLKFDNKIAGRAWVDSVELSPER